MKALLLTNEYPPSVYGGAGVHERARGRGLRAEDGTPIALGEHAVLWAGLSSGPNTEGVDLIGRDRNGAFDVDEQISLPAPPEPAEAGGPDPTRWRAFGAESRATATVANGSWSLSCSPGTRPAGAVLRLKDVVRGGQVMKGYWRMDEETKKSITSDGWFRTGDAAYQDENDYVYIYDRVKDMIVSGGENIYPAEVESALFGHPAVADVAVIGVPDDRWGEAVKAIVVRKPGAALTALCRCTFARNPA